MPIRVAQLIKLVHGDITGRRVDAIVNAGFDPGRLFESFVRTVIPQLPLDQPYRLAIDLTSAPDSAKAQALASGFFNVDPRLVEVACFFTNQTPPGVFKKFLNLPGGSRRGILVIPRLEDSSRTVGKRPLAGDDETILSPVMARENPPLFKLEPEERHRLLRDRVCAGILGAILADALGVPVEFRPREERRQDPVTSMRGHGTYNQPVGTWSDDSSMMLGLLISLTLVGFDPATQGLAYLRWRFGADLTAGGNVFDCGAITNTALQRILSGVSARDAGERDEQANGNGSLMRTLPLTFHLALGGGDFLTEVSLRALFRQSCDASAVTHAHPRSQLACAIYTILGRFLLAGFSLNESLAKTKEAIKAFVEDRPDLARELPLFHRIFDPGFADTPEEEIQSSGYVLHTLEASIWSLLNSTSYREAVLKAVNLGDDTDTTGVVTGGLAGIMYGRDSLPEEWLAALARQTDIQRMIEDFLTKEAVRSGNPEGLISFLNILSQPIFGARGASSTPESRKNIIDRVKNLVEENFDAIEKQLRHASMYPQADAAKLLGLLASERALALLNQPDIGLNDPVWMVRVAAGLGLSVNGSERALALLERTALANLPEEDSLQKAFFLTIFNLGYSDSPLAHRLLIDSFLGHQDPQYRSKAVSGLVTAATHEALAAISRPDVGLRDPLAEIRENAAFGLALHGTKESTDLLDQAGIGLDDPDVNVRVKAAYGLGQAASPESIRLLTTRGDKGLRSRLWQIRAGAANGLGRSVSLVGFQTLINEKVFDDPNTRVRESAADGLYHSPYKKEIEQELEKSPGLLEFVRHVWSSAYKS